MSPRRLLPTAIVAAVLMVTAAPSAMTPQPAAAAGTTLYVDGKHGSDSNGGRSWNEAYRTINRAAREVPRGAAAAGWTVVVRGFADYIYRERPVPGGYDRSGTAGAPLVFRAEGWSPGASDYVKPIVSGAVTAPLPGRAWQPDSTSGVWSTAWDEPPADFDRTKPYASAIFQEATRRLWQHASLADLRRKASRGDGGYWYGAGRLHVATRNGVAPGSVSIEVPTRMGFYFTGNVGAHHISVRGFAIRHAAMGITFHLGADRNSAFDNEVLGNTPMAFATSGRVTGGGVDPAVGNVFLRNKATYSVLQGFKIDAGSRDTVVCDNTVRHNAFQGIKVQGPADGGDPRVTRGTEICHNLLANQDTRRPGASRQDEVPNGLTLSNGARDSYVHHNTIRDNVVGVQVNQRGSGGSPIGGTRFNRNFVHHNRSAGLNLRDGVQDRSAGKGSLLARFNTYWRNGVGIHVHPGSTNKTFEHETVYDSLEAGIEVGCTCGSTAGATIRDSLVTHGGSYGMLVAPGQRVRASHVGLPSNHSGATKGPIDKDHVNTRAAGYRSLHPSNDNFLHIGPSSFQYTAGPGGTPIGARY